MNLFDRINQWLESQINPQTPTLRTSRKQLNDRARVAAYVEQYELALEIFQQAYAMAVQSQDLTAIADAKLNRADILIKQNNLAEAKTLLRELRADTSERKHYAPLAYVLCSLGIIAQLENNWDEARDYYEEARQIAQQEQITGAEGRASGHLADVYLNDNNANYATHLLRQAIPALETSGDNELIAYFMARLGVALIDSGQSEEGEKLLHNALFIASASRQIATVRTINQWLGNYAFEQNQYKNAAIHYQEVLRHKSTYGPTIEQELNLVVRIAYSQYKTHQLSKARKHLSTLTSYIKTSTAPINTTTHLVYLILMAQNNDTSDIKATLAEVVDTLQPPFDGIELDGIQLLATLYENEGNIDKALKIYEMFTDQSETPLVKARLQARQGYLLLKEQKNEHAIHLWEQVVRVFDTQQAHVEAAQLYCDLGEAHLAQGNGLRCQQNYGQALIHLNHIEQKDVRGIILANAAIAYNREGDIENAEPFFREAIEIAEQTQNTHAEIMRLGNYGIFLAQIGDANPSQITIAQAQEKARKLQQPLAIAIQQHNMGYGHHMNGNIDKAIEAYENAQQQLEKLNAGYWLTICRINLANLWLKQGQVTKAQSLFARAKAHHHVSNVPLDIAIGLGEAQIALLNDELDEASRLMEFNLPAAIRCKMPRLMIHAHLLRGRIHHALGQFTNADDQDEQVTVLMERIKMPEHYLPL